MFFCFFSLFLRLPRSTLFPYTTLFRSPGEPPGGRPTPFDLDSYVADQRTPTGVPGGTDPTRHATGPDRKSTRLNSSHLGISYAVFCLKKKKNIILWTRSTIATTTAETV